MSKRSTPPGPSIPSDPVRVRFDRFELDEANATLLREGKPIALAPTPFAVLCALARKPAALLTKNSLLDQVWGHQFVSDSVLKTTISDLRAVLEDDARQSRFIETVSRRGYRFIAATTAIPDASPVRANNLARRSPEGHPFVGRADSLLRLRNAWDAACSGKRSIVWVTGEPGIGKTTLIEHFVGGLVDALCARGQCVEHYGTGEPYLPVLEALAELCRIDSAMPGLLRAVAPTWLLRLPWLSTSEERDALRREVAGVGPERMLREMGELLDRYTERQPLLLVTEDLHWSDRATIQLIDYIARRRGSARFMWLASFRLAEIVALEHPLNSLRHELRLHGLCDEIQLDSFSEMEVGEYVAGRSPTLAGDEAFLHTLHERTDGVPLFVASVMGDVLVRAARRGRDETVGAELANVAVPENLAGIIDHYIAKLSSDHRLLLAAAAACGIEFRVSTLSLVLERDAAWVGETCEAITREQLWLIAARAGQESSLAEQHYAFRHALFRQVLYERTAPSGRSQLHRKIGAALERQRTEGVPVAAAELAMHFERGREVLAALRCYAQAAEAALLHLSPDQCMSLTEHGLTLLEQAPQGPERDSVEIALATLRGVSATQVLGVGSETKSSFQRAYSMLRDAPLHSMHRRLLHDFGLVLCLRADYAEALDVAKRAEALASATDDPILVLAACLVHGEVHQLQGQSRAARTWIDRGLACAESLSVAPAGTFVADPQVTLLGLLAIQLVHAGLVQQARDTLQRAHARAHALAEPMARMIAIWFNALLEVRLGSAERVAALAEEMHALVEEFALAHGRNGYRWFRGWADARMGKPLEGYRQIREAYADNARLGMLSGASETIGYGAEALLLGGDLQAAQEQLQQALHLANTLGERVYLPQLFITEAGIARARGENEAAIASLRRAIAEARAQESPWLELLALTELGVGRGASSDDRRTLATLVRQLPEAADTTLLSNARALVKSGEPDR